MFCGSCGKPVPKNSKFCLNCGAPVEEKAEAVRSSAPSPPRPRRIVLWWALGMLGAIAVALAIALPLLLRGGDDDWATSTSSTPTDGATDPATIPVPGSLMGGAGDGWVELRWEECVLPGGLPGSLEYVVYRDGDALMRCASVEYTDRDVVNGTEYTYQVACSVAGVEGAKSAAVPVTPQAAQQTGGGGSTETTEEKYVLTVLVTGGGSFQTSPDQASYAPGTEVTITAIPVAMSSFDWWGEAGVSDRYDNPLTVVMDRDREITANFKGAMYTLSLSKQGEGTVRKSPDEASYERGTLVYLYAAPASGWIFDGWTGTLPDLNPNNANTIVRMTQDGSAVAHFVQGYTLSITKVGQGTVIKSPNQASYVPGTQVTLTATPAAGYEFSHWYIAGWTTTANPYTLTMGSSASVTAYFEQQ
jgi:hypothetical protein